jgi:hypothetical protein
MPGVARGDALLHKEVVGMPEAAVLVREAPAHAVESVSTEPTDIVPDLETIDFEQLLGGAESRDFRRPVVACNINVSLPLLI